MENLYLIGMRGVGKTTIGKSLARKLSRIYFDLDAEIEQKTGLNISKIVSEHGWDFFRLKEKEVLREVIKNENIVVAVGGGALMYFDNAEQLKKSGTMILLTAGLGAIESRIKNEHRPSLTGSDFISELEQAWNERKASYYQYADMVIDTESKTPEDIAGEIISGL